MLSPVNRIRVHKFIKILPGLFKCLMFYIWLRFLKRGEHAKEQGYYKRVLIVKLDAIGDFILWLDVAKELRTVYPASEYKITLLGNQQWTDLAKTIDYFDEVWAIDRSSFFLQHSTRLELLKKVCSVTFDVVLHPVYSREFLFGDLVVWICDAKQKIGMEGDCSNLNWWQKKIGDRCYTELVSKISNQDVELEHNAQLLRWLGLVNYKAGIPEFRGRYEYSFVQIPKDYYIIFAGSSVSLKMWSANNFVVLVNEIYELTRLTAIVCGSMSEQELGNVIEKDVSAPFINLAGKTALADLLVVISKAKFVVGNDTAGIHIAVPLGIPSVCIVGGGHFGRFIPYSQNIVSKKPLPIPVYNRMECYGCNWKCIYNIQPGEAAPCVNNVPLESVLSAVINLINSSD